MNNKNSVKNNKTLSHNCYILLTILTSIFSVIFVAGFFLLFIYAITLTVATQSPMIFFIVFGGAMFSLAISAQLFFCIQKLRKQAGKEILFSNFFNKTPLQNKKPTTGLVEKKEKITIEKIFDYVALSFLIISTVSIVVSAFLGSISKASWTEELATYKQENGFYSESQSIQLSFEPHYLIIFDLKSKFAVIIYTNTENLIELEYKNEFENQIQISTTENEIKLKENPYPELNGSMEKMLYFVFEPTKNEQQIKIYIPLSLKNQVEFKGNYIFAKD